MSNDLNFMSLEIAREIDLSITEIPHFVVTLTYSGHYITYDDIYFDDIDPIIDKLKVIGEVRKGEVLLDGGMRIKLKFRVLPTGEAVLIFQAEQFEPQFQGECSLSGSFPIDGEYVSKFINALEELFLKGKFLHIERIYDDGILSQMNRTRLISP